ncbi:hypothetical protein ACJJTC_005759 [Scirpophaga incertulas]
MPSSVATARSNPQKELVFRELPGWSELAETKPKIHIDNFSVCSCGTLLSGEYRTERATMTEDNSQEGSRVSGADRARELAKTLGPINMPPGNETRLLTTLTGRSLKRLTDVDNCIEITKNHPDSSESESSTDDDSDYD